MKKKLISVLLSTALVFSMVGCGQAENETNSTKETNTAGADSAQTEQAQAAGGAEDSLYAADAVLKLWGSQDDQEYLKEAISMFKEEYGN